MGSPPQYKEPPLDPVFGQLLMQSQQQGIAATQQDIGSQQARLAARFGTGSYGTSTPAPGSPATLHGAGMFGSPSAPAIPLGGPGMFGSGDPGALLAWHAMQMAAGGAKLPGLT